MPAPRMVPDKDTAQRAHLAELRSLPTSTRLVYTDGSRVGDRLGWSWVERHPRAAAPARVEAGPVSKAEVFDAEVVAIHRAVKRLARGRPAPARVYSDTLAAVEACKCRAAASSQREALEVQSVLSHPQWKCVVQVSWCPGHTGIPGNEEADAAAKTAASAEGEAPRGTPTVAWVKAQARRKKKQIVRQWWNESAPANSSGWGWARTWTAWVSAERRWQGRWLIERDTGGLPPISRSSKSNRIELNCTWIYTL